MEWKRARGFCDLNICATDTDLKKSVLTALSLGYQTIAINREIVDEFATSRNGKRDRSEKDKERELPPPISLSLSEEDLKSHGITRTPVILSRLTVMYSNPASPFLHKVRKAMEAYDLIAFTPTTEAAMKQICTSPHVFNVDILSLDPTIVECRKARKLIGLAIERDVYLELCYAPCLTGTSNRQGTIVLGHSLHQSVRSVNVFVTSRARAPNQLRAPYDVANLARFFGLTEAGAKAAVSTVSWDVVQCSLARRAGFGLCMPQVTLLARSGVDSKFSGLGQPKNNFKKQKLKNGRGNTS